MGSGSILQEHPRCDDRTVTNYRQKISQLYSILSNKYLITNLSASYVAISKEFSKRSGDFLVLTVKYFEIYMLNIRKVVWKHM